MIIIADNQFDYYLCDESNSFYLESCYVPRGRWSWWSDEEPTQYDDVYVLLEGYELGSYDFLFQEAKWFRHVLIRGVKSGITPTEEFFKNYKALARDIKIDIILNDL